MLFYSSSLKNILTAFILVCGLFILIGFGISAGKKKAESKIVFSQILQIAQALDFFYSDNSRFPTADEFARQEVMINYLTRYPDAKEFSGQTCSEAFSYFRPQQNKYQLSFCLLSGVGTFNKGWNKVEKLAN